MKLFRNRYILNLYFKLIGISWCSNIKRKKNILQIQRYSSPIFAMFLL